MHFILADVIGGAIIAFGFYTMMWGKAKEEDNACTTWESSAPNTPFLQNNVGKVFTVSCEGYIGFGCEIVDETARKLQGLSAWCSFFTPDSYVDAEKKDYGGELFMNGGIVKSSPERQRRVGLLPQRHQDRPRFNDLRICSDVHG
ncbi:unnamed protein product [Camellia sinensis]